MITKRDCYLPKRNSMAKATEMSPEAIRQQKVELADKNRFSYGCASKGDKRIEWLKSLEKLK